MHEIPEAKAHDHTYYMRMERSVGVRVTAKIMCLRDELSKVDIFTMLQVQWLAN